MMIWWTNADLPYHFVYELSGQLAPLHSKFELEFTWFLTLDRMFLKRYKFCWCNFGQFMFCLHQFCAIILMWLWRRLLIISNPIPITLICQQIAQPEFTPFKIILASHQLRYHIIVGSKQILRLHMEKRLHVGQFER